MRYKCPSLPANRTVDPTPLRERSSARVRERIASADERVRHDESSYGAASTGSSSSSSRAPAEAASAEQISRSRAHQPQPRSPRDMRAPRVFAPLLAAALLLLAAGARAFSLSRTLHEVDQDVAEDASLYSQEMRLNADLGLPAPGQKSRLEQYITIKESPSPYVTVQRGRRLELKCEVDASPPPRIYWVTGENPGRQVEMLERESTAELSYTAIAREVSKLVIDCVSPQDQSLIHCVGVSGEQIVVSKPTIVNVEGTGNGTCQGGGAPVITRHRPLYFSEMGTTVVLPCEASGKPRPHITWLDGEGQALLDPRFAVQPNGDLVISNIRWQDMDGYKCTASSTPRGPPETEAVTFLYPAARSESEKRKSNAL